MSQRISVHSFRGGTGKSNITANLATIMARRGRRVAVVDTDLQSPGIHALFGIDVAPSRPRGSLNGYLWEECALEEAIVDVGERIGGLTDGRLLLLPAEMQPNRILRVLEHGYDFERLQRGLDEVSKLMELDVLLIDTHPGLNAVTISCIAHSDDVIIVMRPDAQDFQGTAVTVEVARTLALDIPRLRSENLRIAVNKIPASLDRSSVKQEVERVYQLEAAALLPHSDDLMSLGSGGVFALEHASHEWTQELEALSALIVHDDERRRG